MSRSWIKIALVSLSLSAAFPALAFADDRVDAESGTEMAKGDKDREKKFPMKAETFIGKVNERITKMRTRLDKRLDKRGVDEDKQKEVLAKFDASAEQVRAAAKAAGEDGTVTAEEAKAVHELAKELRGKAHKGKNKGEGKGKGKKGKGKNKGNEAASN